LIVVVASRWDDSARIFASRSAEHEVRLLTPQDLSVAGWRNSVTGPNGGAAVIDRELVQQKDITGVLTRLPCIDEEELPHIAAEDWAYVAAEMTAFLLFWLSHLKCPVLNRPTPSCLSGPYWRRESWVHAAAQAGIPVNTVHRQAHLGRSDSEQENASLTAVTVVGERTFGEASKTLRHHARQLARQTGIEMLVARFSSRGHSARFVSADTYPDLSDDIIGNAVLEFLQLGSRTNA
jgi:hypothetical protein